MIVKTAPARETSTSAIAQDLNRTRVRPVNDAYDAYPSLELDRPAPHVLRLTLRAPGKLNAVSGTMHRELAGVWRTIADDDETHAVLVRGADGAFSAGGDLDLVLEIANDHATRQRVFHEARDLVYNVIDCPKPIVSAMTGHAIGAGLAVGLLADVSIATPNARDRRRAHEARRRGRRPCGDHLAAALRDGEGEVPPAALRAGRRRRGRAHRARLALRPRGRARGARARDRDAARDGAQPALRHTKLALNNWLRLAGPAFDASLALEFLDMTGPDVHEGVAAIREKRPPNFG